VRKNSARSLTQKAGSVTRKGHRERGEARAKAQHEILISSLEKVAGDAEGENGGWKIKLIIFVGGTSGSKTLNDNLKDLQVIESKRIHRSGLWTAECARQSLMLVISTEKW
jgi:hypothetical protein